MVSIAIGFVVVRLTNVQVSSVVAVETSAVETIEIVLNIVADVKLPHMN